MAGLTGHVSVRDADGQTHSFGPGDYVPDWAAKQVTNPRLWEDGEVPFPEKRSKGDKPAGAAAAGAVSEIPTQELEDRIVARVLEGVGQLLGELIIGEDPDDGEGDGPPPLEGKGSGVTAWRKYAGEHQVDTEGLDRDQIVAKLREAEVPVE